MADPNPLTVEGADIGALREAAIAATRAHQRKAAALIRTRAATARETSRVNMARVMLTRGHPFEAALLGPTRVYMAGDDSEVKTAATNCWKTIWLSGEFIEKLSDACLKTVIAHETYHIAMRHGGRGMGREASLWNLATDLWINALLKRRGFSFDDFVPVNFAQTVDRLSLPFAKLFEPELPEGKVSECLLGDDLDPELSAEWIYEQLKRAVEQNKDENGDGEGGQAQGDSRVNEVIVVVGGDMGGDIMPDAQSDHTGDGQPGGETDDGRGDAGEDNRSAAQVDPNAAGQEMGQRMAQGAIAERAHAKRQGSHVDPFVNRLVGEETKQRVPWRVLLRRMVKTEVAKADWSHKRPDRRALLDDLILPSLHSEEVGSIAVACDTSCSVGPDELSAYVNETRNIAYTLSAKLVDVAFVDTQVRHTQQVRRGQRIEFEPAGGGGTEFDPAFRWLEDLPRKPAVFVYFTDGYCEVTAPKPGVPVIWCLIGPHVTDQYLPWGRIVHADF